MPKGLKELDPAPTRRVTPDWTSVQSDAAQVPPLSVLGYRQLAKHEVADLDATYQLLSDSLRRVYDYHMIAERRVAYGRTRNQE